MGLEKVRNLGDAPGWVCGERLPHLNGLRDALLRSSFGAIKDWNPQIRPQLVPVIVVAVVLRDDRGLEQLLKVLRTVFKDEFRHYIVFLPDSTALESFTGAEFKRLHDHHWGIEQFHRAIKQVCKIERFYVRDYPAIHTHIFSALRAFVQLEFKRVAGAILNWHEVKRNLFNPLISAFIQDHLAEMADI